MFYVLNFRKSEFNTCDNEGDVVNCVRQLIRGGIREEEIEIIVTDEQSVMDYSEFKKNFL